ncbi:MAG: 6-pyruvoyl trahydropterin synthase family protein [Planctomycetota bacterium]
MREHYGLLLEKEYFKFSCAHFLIFPDGSKERLHGHNYQVTCAINAALSDSGLVLDFIEVKPVIRGLCDELDEHYILPAEHPGISHEELDDGHIAWRYRDCRYLAPCDEVLLLPINNSSVENLARWFAHELLERLRQRFGELSLTRLQVAISETSGQSGVYTLEDG